MGSIFTLILELAFVSAIIISALKTKNTKESNDRYIENDDSNDDFLYKYIMLCTIHEAAQRIADEEERRERREIEEEERKERRLLEEDDD